MYMRNVGLSMLMESRKLNGKFSGYFRGREFNVPKHRGTVIIFKRKKIKCISVNNGTNLFSPVWKNAKQTADT